MIYLLLSAVSAFFGVSDGLGPATLLRPLLDAVSPLPPDAVAMLATMATLCAALVSAFFALSQPLPLHQEELLLLAVGALLGGVLLGIIEILSSAYISTELSNAIVFAVLIVILLVKPTGLLGKKIREKV